MNSRNSNSSGLTLAEVLIALVILALGLAGILSTFPVGQKFASHCEEYSLSTIISSNYAAIIRSCEAGASYSASTYTGPLCFEETGSPKSPVDSQFKSNPFELKIFPVGVTVLHDATAGHSNYEVSVSRARTDRGTYDLYLIVVHREGSESMQHMLVGRGYDEFELEDN